MADAKTKEQQPTLDVAEDNAFFPSPYSLEQFTAPMSDLADFHYPRKYQGKKKILVIASDERYLLMDNGTFFSTGNHPVETLVPMVHLASAGFTFDVATLSGNPVKFEFWAMPKEDERLRAFFEEHKQLFKEPKRLADIRQQGFEDYFALYIPGGHGALIVLPESEDVQAALEAFQANQRFIITICHGPAALLAARLQGKEDAFPFRGYNIMALPDNVDKNSPDIGYMPGHLRWYMGERLQALGVHILNDSITGAVYRDRNLLSGDSPVAANNLGKLAATTLLDSLGSTNQ